MLKNEVAQLQMVEIRPGASKEFILGAYKGNRIRYFWVGGNFPLLIARYFAFPGDSSEVFFLDQLRIYTRSEINGAKFNVRIYGVSPDGSPGQYLYDENIYVFARKGWKETEVDLSDLHIVFPEKGLFIALESLHVEENRYIQTIKTPTTEGKSREVEMELNAPAFGRVPEGVDEWGWRFSQGRWKQEGSENQISPGPAQTPPAVELRLIN